MKPLPRTENSLMLRTHFSDDAAWRALCAAIEEPSEDGFKAVVDCISDPAYAGLTIEQLVTLSPQGIGRSFAFIADQKTGTFFWIGFFDVDIHLLDQSISYDQHAFTLAL